MAIRYDALPGRDLLRYAMPYWTCILTGCIVLYLLSNKYQRGLTNLPGPKLAAYTKLWRLYDLWKGSAHLTAIELHKKHGVLVRVGPNHVSISDPKCISTIYGIKQNYTKTGFYPIQSISWKKQPAMNLFSTRDPEFHRVQRRKYGSAFSLPNILQSEEAMDNCIRLLMTKMDTFIEMDQSVNMGAWLQYYAFDVIGEVTFASRFGFLEQGRDVDGMVAAIKGMLVYASFIGQIPEWHKYLLGNPLFTKVMPAMETWDQVVVFTLKAINSRAAIKRDGELIHAESDGRDMLSYWARVKSSDPTKMSTRDIVVALSASVFAGSDTTAIALRAVVYFLCRQPEAMAKVVAEIDAADNAGKLGEVISYKQSTTELPYFQAVLKESMRLHSSVGLIMERHVPAEGLDIDGHHLPGGTIVGINPWVTNRDSEVFPEPESFKPERWIDASDAELKQMDHIWEFNFGGGARKCLGRYISWLEMSKVLPQLFRNYDVRLTHSEKEWTVRNRWFVQQEGLECSLRRREATSK